MAAAGKGGAVDALQAGNVGQELAIGGSTTITCVPRVINRLPVAGSRLNNPAAVAAQGEGADM